MDFSEDEAVDLLNILQQDELKYQVQGEESILVRIHIQSKLL